MYKRILFPTDGSQITLKALCYFDDGGLRALPQGVKDRLTRAAAAFDQDRLA